MSNHRLRNNSKLDLVKGRFKRCLTIFSWSAIMKKGDLCATDRQLKKTILGYSIPSDRQFSSNFDFSVEVMIQVQSLM